MISSRSANGHTGRFAFPSGSALRARALLAELLETEATRRAIGPGEKKAWSRSTLIVTGAAMSVIGSGLAVVRGFV
jgi:hypothetical protein